MGHFGHVENLWAVLVGAILVHSPFWYRPALIMITNIHIRVSGGMWLQYWYTSAQRWHQAVVDVVPLNRHLTAAGALIQARVLCSHNVYIQPMEALDGYIGARLVTILLLPTYVNLLFCLQLLTQCFPSIFLTWYSLFCMVYRVILVGNLLISYCQFSKVLCTKNSESWLAVEKVIAINSFVLGHPVYAVYRCFVGFRLVRCPVH